MISGWQTWEKIPVAVNQCFHPFAAANIMIRIAAGMGIPYCDL
jgi:hypothetical protein